MTNVSSTFGVVKLYALFSFGILFPRLLESKAQYEAVDYPVTLTGEDCGSVGAFCTPGISSSSVLIRLHSGLTDLVSRRGKNGRLIPRSFVLQVYIDKTNVDDYLVNSISQPAYGPNAAEVYYRWVPRFSPQSTFRIRVVCLGFLSC